MTTDLKLADQIAMWIEESAKPASPPTEDPALAAVEPHRQAWEAPGEASSRADRATGAPAKAEKVRRRRADQAERDAINRLAETAQQTRARARAVLAYVAERMRGSLGQPWDAETTGALLEGSASSPALQD